MARDPRLEGWRRESAEVLTAAAPAAEVGEIWGTVELLLAVDPVLEGAGDDPDARLVRAAAIALGEALTRELTVEWSEDPESPEEPALRFAGSEVVLYPRRMVLSHLAGSRRDGAPVRLERLVSSTAAYLDHLVRYFPSRLGLARRSRGSRRAPSA